jgi:hypothetical protein
VHARTEDKTVEMKDRFHAELERVLNKFSKYHMKILLGDFSANAGGKYIFNPTTGNESYKIGNSIGVRGVKFATSKHLIVKSSHIATFVNLLGHPDGMTHIRFTIF